MDRPPVVWIPVLGHGAHLHAWRRRPSGWWAEVTWIESTPYGRSYADSWADCAASIHASLVEPRQGHDYSRVPRIAPP